MTGCWQGKAMHELSICQAPIDQVEADAREPHAAEVVAVKVAIAPLPG